MQKEMIEKNVILKLTFDFSLLVIDYCGRLEEKKKFVTSRQLLRSGTSIGANSFKAQPTQSKGDFIHKIEVAAKECDETQYWLLLCDYSKDYPDCKILLQKQKEVRKVLNNILSTSKRKNPFSYLLSFFIF